MVDKRRVKRLEKVILQTLGPLVSHRLTDPRLHMVTVTRVRLARDLSIAHVNWSVIGSVGDRSKATHALADARGYLQSAVAKNLQTKATPRLEFHYDDTMEKAARVNEILHGLARERAEREGTDEEE